MLLDPDGEESDEKEDHSEIVEALEGIADTLSKRKPSPIEVRAPAVNIAPAVTNVAAPNVTVQRPSATGWRFTLFPPQSDGSRIIEAHPITTPKA